MQPNPSLKTVLERCYAVFARYPRPFTLEASPFRDADAIMRDLTAAPLHELAGKQIGPYSGYALTTVGDVADYKHFLPRILELAVLEPVWVGTDPIVIGGKLDRAEWKKWPPEEQEAVRAVLLEGMSQAVQEHPDLNAADPEQWLWGLAMLDVNAAGLLQTLIALPSSNAALQVAKFISSARRLFRDSRERELPHEALSAVRGWLLSDAPQHFLVEASSHVDAADQWQIDAAFEELGCLRAEHAPG